MSTLQFFTPKAVRSSMLSTDDTCPRKFFYLNRMCLKRTRGKLSLSITRGTLFHELVLRLYQGLSPADAETAVGKEVFQALHAEQDEAAQYDPQAADNVKTLDQAWPIAKMLARIFWEKYPLNTKRYQVLAVEKELVYNLGYDLPVQGTIDLILGQVGADVAWITDHKTISRRAEDEIIGRKWSYQARLYPQLASLYLKELHGPDASVGGFIYNFVQVPTIVYCRKDPTFEDYVKRCGLWYGEKGIEPCKSYALPAPDLGTSNHIVDLCQKCVVEPCMESQLLLDTQFPRVCQPMAGCSFCKIHHLCEADLSQWSTIIEAEFTVNPEEPAEELEPQDDQS
jgi:hypothetical protein